MKNYLIPISTVLFLFISVAAVHSVVENSPIGSWAFSVDQAPWEYNRGTIVIEQNEEMEFTGVIYFHTGQEIPIVNISVEDDEMTFDVDVDGNVVRSIVNIEADQLNGHVVTMEGNMPFLATREVVGEEEEE